MEIAVPEGCTLSDVAFEAETHEAFDAAVEGQHVSIIGPIASGDGAYTFRSCTLQVEPYRIVLRSPDRRMRLVDA